MSDTAIIIDRPTGIRWFHMRAQLSALKLDIAGLPSSRGSIYAHIKRTYGLKGTKQRVYDQFAVMVEAAKQEALADCGL